MPKQPSLHLGLPHFQTQAEQLVEAHRDGHLEAFVRIKAHGPQWADASVQALLDSRFMLADAQQVIAYEYGFENWTALVAAVEGDAHGDTLVTDPRSLACIAPQLDALAAIDFPVLLCGERGTGKRLAARVLHQRSGRKRGPFLQTYGLQQHPILLDSELFGHEAGAFTGAQQRRVGKVELGRGGTLFIERIDALPPELQTKLLILLREGTFERVGGAETLEADVRIIAACSTDLVERVQAGAFCADLALLLERATLTIPALRDRGEEQVALAQYIAQQMAASIGGETPTFSQGALSKLQAYDWPGNVRELELRVQRAVLNGGSGPIKAEDIDL